MKGPCKFLVPYAQHRAWANYIRSIGVAMWIIAWSWKHSEVLLSLSLGGRLPDGSGWRRLLETRQFRNPLPSPYPQWSPFSGAAPVSFRVMIGGVSERGGALHLLFAATHRGLSDLEITRAKCNADTGPRTRSRRRPTAILSGRLRSGLLCIAIHSRNPNIPKRW
jgi:hypothetical protein